MTHTITAVKEKSIAARNGIRAGDELIRVNGEELIDDIDYQKLTGRVRVDLLIRRDGEEKTVQLLKPREAPLGMTVPSLGITPRHCKNKCVFCFIDQMPGGMRPTLYVKDDDWRMSLMMGNYITLTNVDEAEFERILKRKASPLYISVHATDPEKRVSMMRNPAAAQLMPRLERLKERGLQFHCQIVLCPGLNDGETLERTLRDLSSLWPAARSAALVPVGLTKCREGLPLLQPFDRESAERVMLQADRWQKECMQRLGTRFVYPADEMVLLSGRKLPEDPDYEGYPQIENGVGLLRKFENALLEAMQDFREEGKTARPRRVLIPCGTSVAPSMREWMEKYAPEGVSVTVLPVVNRFFGPTVTVTGLLTGGDLMDAVEPVIGEYDEVLLCGDTLRSEKDLFLDDMPLSELRERLQEKLTVVENTGNALYEALLGQHEIGG